MWERAMQKMKELNESAWKDMMDTPAQLWAKLYFKTYTKYVSKQYV